MRLFSRRTVQENLSVHYNKYRNNVRCVEYTMDVTSASANTEQLAHGDVFTIPGDNVATTSGLSTSATQRIAVSRYELNESFPPPPTPPSPPVFSHQNNMIVASRESYQRSPPTCGQASMIEEGVHPSGIGTEPSSRQLESFLPDILYSRVVRGPPSVQQNHNRQHRVRQRHEDSSTRRNRRHHRHSRSRSGRVHRHSSRRRSVSSSQSEDGICKEPCVKFVVVITSFRLVLAVLSILGVCCVITGIVLAALHAAGQSFLFLAIMFIGLGVLIVIVVAVGFKCTPRGHEPLHAMFGIGGFMHRRSRNRRHRRHGHRDRNWLSGMMYPEFQFRRPPPSYSASMQEYQCQILPDENSGSDHRNLANTNERTPPNSPPPSYRSRTSTGHIGIHTVFPVISDGGQPSSRPPTYRSRAPSRRPSFPRELEIEQDSSDIGIEAESHPEVLPEEHLSNTDTQTYVTASSPLLVHQMTQESAYTVTLLEMSHQPKHATYICITSPESLSTSEDNIQADSQSSTSPVNTPESITCDSSTGSSQQFLASPVPAGTRINQLLDSESHVVEQTLQSLEEHLQNVADTHLHM